MNGRPHVPRRGGQARRRLSSIPAGGGSLEELLRHDAEGVGEQKQVVEGWDALAVLPAVDGPVVAPDAVAQF